MSARLGSVSARLVSRFGCAASALALALVMGPNQVAAAAGAAGAAPVLARGTHIYGPSAKDVTLHDGAGKLIKSLPFASLSQTELAPATYEVRLTLPAGESVELPPCSGASRVSATVNGKNVLLSDPGPVVTRVPEVPSTKGARAALHAGTSKDAMAEPAARTEKAPIAVTIRFSVSAYERRIACGYAPRSGLAQETSEELRTLRFDSRGAGKCQGACTPGKAIVFIPRGHDSAKPGAVLVGVHPWNGSIWTYAAYQELLAAAQQHDVVLLFPSGLGNSLYTANAETEVLAALEALGQALPVDATRVSIWGASMGGAGATTIGFHHPDRFATITSFFGDAKYDLAGYVRGILPTEAAAHKVNPLDAIENARHVPVWLIHGENDKTSPIKQSEMLYAALSERSYRVRFDRDKNAGHDGALVAKHAADVVRLAASAKAPRFPSRVSLKLVRPEDQEAYGVRVERSKANDDAVLDIERTGAGNVVIHAAVNVARITLANEAMSAGSANARGAERPTAVDYKGTAVTLKWVP